MLTNSIPDSALNEELTLALRLPNTGLSQYQQQRLIEIPAQVAWQKSNNEKVAIGLMFNTKDKQHQKAIKDCIAFYQQ